MGRAEATQSAFVWLPSSAWRMTSLLSKTLPRSCVSESLQQCCAPSP